MTRDDGAAGLWGFAEAVLWFIIPDVLISYVGVERGLRAALRLTAFAVVGAVLGGLVSYAWGVVSVESGQAAMAALPGVDTAMVESVSADVAAQGSSALLEGPTRTQPYKLYALAAGEHRAGMLELALWTIPGRAARFIVSSLGAAAFGWASRRFLNPRMAILGWAVFWVLVYTVVWTR